MKQDIPAADPRFRYEGRFDFSDPAAPVVIWQASRIAIDFEGDSLDLTFGTPTDPCFFNVEIDGKSSIVSLVRGAEPTGVSFSDLGAGRHHLVLFKRSEAAAGIVTFRGIAVAAGARVCAPPPPDYKLRMEFLGDSMTVGACNEDLADDQWENRRTHNSARSYAALTASAFSADHRNTAISGMGMVMGYVDIRGGEFWDKLYPSAKSPRADLHSWVPDVVVLNLGENDTSIAHRDNLAFPRADYTKRYVDLVRAIRVAWPKAEIVLLRGGMGGSKHDEPLREAWEYSVAELEKSDTAITHFVFDHWSQNHPHPRMSDDRAMADELIAWLRVQPWMAAWC